MAEEEQLPAEPRGRDRPAQQFQGRFQVLAAVGEPAQAQVGLAQVPLPAGSAEGACAQRGRVVQPQRLGEFRRGLDLWGEAYAMARSRGDRLQQAWGLNGQAEGLLRSGGPDELEQVVSLLAAAGGLFTENADKISVLATHGLLAAAQLRRGDQQAAWEAAEQGMQLIRAMRAPASYYMLGGYHGVAAAYLGLWEAANHDHGPLLAQRARAACRALRHFARILPLGAPAAAICAGRAAWLAGRRRAAIKAWKAALKAAARLRMPYEEGLAHLELARHLAAAHPDRPTHLARARKIFAAVGARFDLERALE